MLIISSGLSLAGMAALTQLSTHGGYLSQIAWQSMLIGAGFGLAIPAITIAGTTGVPRDQAGLASGLINATRQMYVNTSDVDRFIAEGSRAS